MFFPEIRVLVQHRFLSTFPLFLLFCLSLFAQSERVIYAGANASCWETQLPRDMVSVDFDYEELRYDAEAHALDWRYCRHAADDLTQNLVRYAPIGFVPAQRFEVEMRNLSPVPVTVNCGVRFHGEGGVGWLNDSLRVYDPLRELPNDGEWHTLVFNCVVRGPLVQKGFPKPFLDIRTNGFPANTPMHFQIRKVVACDPEPVQGVLEPAFSLPAELEAGEPLRFPEQRARFAGTHPADPRAWLEIAPTDGIGMPLRIPFTYIRVEGDTWILGAETLPISKYLFDKEYIISIHCGEAVPQGGEQRVRIQGHATTELSRVEVKEHLGAPILHINGEPYTGMMRATYAPGFLGAKAFYESGLRILGFCSNANEQGYFLSRTVAVSPGEMDFAEFDERAQEMLAVAPDAYLIPRIYLSAPEWWLREHPEAIVVEETANGVRRPFFYDGGRPCPSWFSQEWRDYTSDCLAKLVEHIAQSPYADRVLGFVLASGSTEEWDSWSGQPHRWVDYSEAARDSFRAWLKTKYHTDDALQTAWHDETATLDAVELPTFAERADAVPSGAELRSMEDAKDLLCTDYYLWTAEATADCIAQFCHAVKTASENHLVCGPFYGYSLELQNDPRLLNSGHLGIWKLLDNPDVDFLCGPADYRYRHTGHGGDFPKGTEPKLDLPEELSNTVVNPWYVYHAGTPMTLGPQHSLKLHNKFWFTEMDYRTSDTPCELDYCGRPADLQGDLDQQEKVAVHTLCTGSMQWWFDVGYVRFDNPQVLACIKNIMRAIEEGIRSYDRTSEAEIAVIVDERSFAHLRPNSSLSLWMCSIQSPLLERLGNTVEYYLAEDLENLPERIRMVFVTTSFAPTEAHAAALRKLRKDGRVFVYMFGPGLYPFREGLSSAQSMQEFTGMPLAVDFKPALCRAVIDAPDGKWLPTSLRGRKLIADWHHITRNPKEVPTVNPFVYAKSAQPHTRILAHYGDGRGALAIYDGGDWTGIWSGVDELPRELLLAACKKAGVHRYCEDPVLVWAAKGMVGVCVEQGGDYTIRLKHPAKVHDALTNETFATDENGVFTASFRNNQTRLFFLLP